MRPVSGSKSVFYAHVSAAGVVARVAGGVAEDLVVFDSCGLGGFFVQAGDGGGHIKYLDDRRALGAAVFGGDTADIVRSYPGLTVRRAGQGHESGPARDGVYYLHRVAHGVDIRVRGAHVAVHLDGALRAQLQARGLGEVGLRHDAHGQHYEAAVDGLLALHMDADAVFYLFIALYCVFKAKVQALFAQVGVYLAGHIPIERREDLLAALQERDLHAGLHEIFRGLEADEASADHYGALGLFLLDESAHFERVLDCAEGQDSLGVDAGRIRDHGLRAGGEDERVVALDIFPALVEAEHGDGLFLPVYGGDFARDAHVHVEAGEEALWGLEGEVAVVLDHAAYVIGQAAVRVGDEARALNDNYLRLLVQPAEPGCRSRAARDAADYDYFAHVVSSLYIGVICSQLF